MTNKPLTKPSNPNFSSGPCAKRPGWSIDKLKNSIVGRSHRSKECKSKLNYIIEKSKEILNLPKDYLVGILPGSDTGSIEAALWSLLGNRGVDVLAWENFGKDWVKDIVNQLKIKDCNVYEVDYGKIPNFKNVNFDNDVIFTWNGTTSGVKIPDANWIDQNRKGLTICDATSAIFAMPIDYLKCDVLTWSWQKVLGGEAAHGMIALSPRAIERLENYTPDWPIPKIFRLSNKQKLITGIFEGSTINTPSMICVEDAIDSLNWVEEIGGLNVLIKNSTNSFNLINEWIIKNSWVDFLADSLETKYLSNTSITFKIVADWYVNKDESDQRLIIKNICNLLSENNIAYDINGYNKAPPSFRIWAGGTVLTKDVENLLPWIDWAYEQMRAKYA
tara:strand:+ start:8580 stop:9746 length:1167 start_codon:yes stop_codon:yes gene_type:complete